MRRTTIGWTFVLNVAVVASLSLRPFKIYDWTYGKDVPPGARPRIYNGLEAREGQFKFMIIILAKVDERVSLCSASLVAPSWALTAGHCLTYPDLERVVLAGGRSDFYDYIYERMKTPFDLPLIEKTYSVQERFDEGIYIHPDYNNTTYEHDLALIRTNKPFLLGKTVTTIPLSTQKMTSRKICTILGWGMVQGNEHPFKLNYVEGKEVSTTELGCVVNKEGRFICLMPSLQGICRGDSGSPLVCEGKVWGVASHMEAPTGLNYNCGDQTAEYYTEIYYDSKWILSYVSGGNVSRYVNPSSLLSSVIISFCLSMTI